MRGVWISAIIFVFLIGCLVAVPLIEATDSDSIIVSGIGYPPIRAQSKAQALLMAKRAAVLDAYRNALRVVSGEVSETYDKTFYENLSGFVKGMKIISEDYLDDGGVRIEAIISSKDPSIFQKGKYVTGAFSENQGSPEKVTVEEWYRIISGMVRIEK
ncbi:MAG: hypothetical protein AB1480_04185 [Nitrospirota bacterium]